MLHTIPRQSCWLSAAFSNVVSIHMRILVTSRLFRLVS